MKTFLKKIQDKKLIYGVVTAIAFISFSIALSSSVVLQKYSLLFKIMPYLTKLANPSLILGIIILLWYLGWAIFTPYSPVDKKAVALHISGRIKGVLYDAHGALKYYRKAQEKLAQADEKGNVNVSKFGSQVAGCGGFINISQNAKKVVFCGTFTASGLDISIREGKIIINKEGKHKKFIKQVEQITFSGEYAMEKGQSVLYVTERAVFRLDKGKIVLIEVAPGIDLGKHVISLMDFKPVISPDLKTMDEEIFLKPVMNLKKTKRN